MLRRRHVLGQQAPVDDSPFDLGLKHRKDVAVHLRLVGDQRSGRVQDAGIDLPSGSRLQLEGAGEKEDAVVALVPVLETAPHIGLGRSRLEPHERVRKMVFELVVLRRKVIRLGLAAAADARGILVALVHVMRNRAQVVEELAEQVPAAIARHDRRSDQQIAGFLDRHLAAGTAGHRRDGRSSAPRPAGVPGPLSAFVVDENHRSLMPPRCPPSAYEIVGVQFEPTARQHEGARHPRRRQAKDARAGVDGVLNCCAIDHSSEASSGPIRGVRAWTILRASRAQQGSPGHPPPCFTVKDDRKDGKRG